MDVVLSRCYTVQSSCSVLEFLAFIIHNISKKCTSEMLSSIETPRDVRFDKSFRIR